MGSISTETRIDNKKTAHTPGPWRVSGPEARSGSLAYVITAAEPRMDVEGWEIAELDTGSVAESAENPDKFNVLCDEFTRANANLIAAAPDLYAALLALANRIIVTPSGFLSLVDDEPTRLAATEASAAIAKAEGSPAK